MHDYNYYLRLVEGAVSNINYPSRPAELYKPIAYTMSQGGKRVRPVLTLMTCEAMGGDLNKAVDVALGIELFHNFTLLHDDLMDRAEVRRGKTCVHRKWNDNTAILSGDNMLVLAFNFMQQCDREKMPAVMQIFTQTAVEIDEGQQYDIEFETRDDVTEAEYIEMIRLKTSVLLACALQIGATLAGASDADAQALYRYGECLGLAFQLQDDFLDVYGDPAVFGKKIGGDILCDKKTFMLINALLHASDKDKAELQRWIGCKDCNPDDKIKAVTAIYTNIGVDRMAKERMNAYYAEAETYLAQLNVPEERKQMLRDIALELMGRQK